MYCKLLRSVSFNDPVITSHFDLQESQPAFIVHLVLGSFLAHSARALPSSGGYLFSAH